MFIYKLLLPDGKTGETLELSIKPCSFGNREELGRKEIIKLDVKKTGLHWFTVAFHCRTFVMMLKYLGLRPLTDRDKMTPSLEADSQSVAKKCPFFHVTRIYITVFKIITLCCVSWIRQSNPTLISYPLTLHSHPSLYNPKGFFCPGLPTKYMYTFLISSMHVTCLPPPCLSLLILLPLEYLTNISNYETITFLSSFLNYASSTVIRNFRHVMQGHGW